MMLKSSWSFSLTKPLPLRSRTLTRLTSLVPFALALWRFEEYIFSILYFVSLLHLPLPSMNTCHPRMSPTPTGYGDIFPTSTLAASSAGAPCHLRPVATATLQLCASRSTLWNYLLLFYLYLRSLQLQEHHDISVIGCGDILPGRFEETPSL